MTEKWECFCDAGYYHKWAVRDANGDRKFESAIHVNTREEAEFLVERLNQPAAERVKGLVEAAQSALDGGVFKHPSIREKLQTALEAL